MAVASQRAFAVTLWEERLSGHHTESDPPEISEILDEGAEPPEVSRLPGH